MDKARIIEKIKKCMALGNSSNAHEAAAALRQAQKMMELHGLDETDIEGSKYSNDTVEVPIQANKKTPVHLVRFVNLIKAAFQVKAVVETNVRISDESYRIRYFGQTYRVQMALYAHTVIFRGMESAWKKHVAENPRWKGVRGARLSFMIGWLDEIKSKVEAIGWPEGEEEMTKNLLEKYYGCELTTRQGRKFQVYAQVNDAGKSAASQFNIHRPMQGEQQKRLA